MITINYVEKKLPGIKEAGKYDPLPGVKAKKVISASVKAEISAPAKAEITAMIELVIKHIEIVINILHMLGRGKHKHNEKNERFTYFTKAKIKLLVIKKYIMKYTKWDQRQISKRSVKLKL